MVFPGRGTTKADLGITSGKIAAIGSELAATSHAEIDARGKLVVPGVIDSHFHLGIFRPFAIDAEVESASAAAGGVTTVLAYHRAGRNNLFEDVVPALPGSYVDIFTRLLKGAEGRFWTDYGFHLAPVTKQHVTEIPRLVRELGVTNFKYYMHYRGVDPRHYQAGRDEKEYVFSDTGYDLGHLRDMMQQVASVNRDGTPARVSVHAEHPGIIRDQTRATKEALATLASENALQLYSRSRPPGGERLAIAIVAELAAQTGCPVNVLHISSADALAAVREARRRYASLDLLAETTVHHLGLANDEYGMPDAKVNPPIRTSRDRDELWGAVVRRDVQTVVSDHAAIDSAHKGDDIWSAWYGFGGTEILLPTLLTEGHRRGVPYERIMELLSLAPARHHGLLGTKGDIAVGYDADLAICDVSTSRVVDHRQLHSAQDFSPFDGMELSGWVETTVLRGAIVYQRDAVVGTPSGHYLKRPQ